jgi:osmotically-inducible protein OsmY
MTPQLLSISRRLGLRAVAAALCASALTACVPLIVGGAFLGGTLVATDRRTSGAQLEDEGIELRANSRLRASLSDGGHVNITSYNRQVLLSGEVSSEQEKKMAEDTVARVDNVQKIINELAVMGVSTFPQRSSDTLITGRVRAALVDDKELYANAFKVVTERSVTYLMGRVTQREAERATEIARTTPGVQKVVRMIEIISEEDLKRLLPQPAKPSSAPRNNEAG